MSHFIKTGPKRIDPFGKMTASMELFEAFQQNWYISKDGFKHELKYARHRNIKNQINRMTTTCLACNANRTDKYEEIQTKENELIAVEVAQWQMNHRESCKIPLGWLKIG